jgi:hypothetical protein
MVLGLGIHESRWDRVFCVLEERPDWLVQQFWSECAGPVQKPVWVEPCCANNV